MQHVYMYMYILCFTCTCFNNINIIAVADWWCRTVGVYDCSAGRHRKNPRKRKTEKRLKGKRIIWIHAMVSGPTKPIGCGEKLSMSRLMSARMQLPFHRALNTSSGVEYNLSLDIPVLSTPSWHTGRVMQKKHMQKKKKHAEIFETLLTCPHPPVFSGEKDGNIFTVSTDHPPSPQHHQ